MRRSLHLALADLGQLSLASTLPYLLGGLLADRLVARVGLRLTLLGSVVIGFASLLGWTVAPAWWQIVVSVALLGAVKGVLDAALNAVVALRSGVRRLGLLHASWALGGTLGPVIVASVVVGGDWRVAVAVVAALAGFLIPFAALAPRPARLPGGSARPRPLEPPSNRRAMAATVVAFSAYTAAEGGPIAWGATYLVGDRHLSASSAAFAMAAFWAALTLGRLALALPSRWRGQRLLESSCLLFLLGTGLIWALPGKLAVVGLALAGLGSAPIFPLYVALTPERFGPALTGRAVGYAIAGAAAGGPVAIYLFGILAGRFGTAVLAPCLFGAGVLMYLGHRLLSAAAGEGGPVDQAVAGL